MTSNRLLALGVGVICRCRLLAAHLTEATCTSAGLRFESPWFQQQLAYSSKLHGQIRYQTNVSSFYLALLYARATLHLTLPFANICRPNRSTGTEDSVLKSCASCECWLCQLMCTGAVESFTPVPDGPLPLPLPLPLTLTACYVQTSASYRAPVPPCCR